MDNYHFDNSGSINSILNSFSSDMFDGITFVMRPAIGGIDYLRSMHKSYQFQNEIKKISNFSFETREIIIDSLTDIIIGKTLNQDLDYDLEKRLSELDEVNAIFKKLENLTQNLDPTQIPKMLQLSLRRLNGRISSIRDEINMTMWNKDEDIDHLLVLDQIFYLTQEIIKNSLKGPVEQLINQVSWNVIIFSLLYIEAFHRKKVTFEEVQDFLSELSMIGYNENYDQKNNAIFEVLSV